MNEKEKKIIELTKERKKIERKIKRLERKLAISDFFMNDIKIRSYSKYRGSYNQKAPLSVLLGTILTFISIPVVLLCFPNLSLPMMGLGVGLSFLPLATSAGWYIYEVATRDGKEKKLEELVEQRKEIIKQIDCVRTDTEYVAPEPVKSQAQILSEFFTEMAKRHEEAKAKKRESLLEKARLRHIDIDKVLSGPEAFDSKKDYKKAKKEVNDFLEENNTTFKEIM